MIKYEGSIYRPPSEAQSLIIQATIGCSHNACSFCTMYRQKSFRARTYNEIKSDLEFARQSYSYVRRIFLADGDAMILSFEKLSEILVLIQKLFPECERVGIYGTSKSINIKTDQELLHLRKLGLGIVYIGLESGNDTILASINKGEQSADIVAAGIKAKKAGMLTSVTAISGIGGKDLRYEHAFDTAIALSDMNPDYIGFLSLMLEPDTRFYETIKSGQFQLLSPVEIVEEMLTFLKNIDSPNTVFRCNHASNYFSLYGNLNKDIPSMILELDSIMSDSFYKSENLRRL